MNRINRWAVGLTTAPRPQPSLDRTLAGLRVAGWSDVRVFDDVEGIGAWQNWIGGLRSLIQYRPDAQAYLMVQDDALFCRNLRAYLEETLWPATGTALCSPYCPTPYRQPTSGWHEEKHGWYLVGAVCWAIPPGTARQIVRQLGAIEAERQIDARIGQWALFSGRSVWYHTPSLVQHVGCGNSALGDPLTISLRLAEDFVGENKQWKAES